MESPSRLTLRPALGRTNEMRSLRRRERTIARTLQAALLPDRLRHFPGITLTSKYFPRDGRYRVGGDWYDAFALPDGRLALSIGDACGHGVAASIAMAGVRQSIRTAAHLTTAPDLVFECINAILLIDPAVQPVTAIYGILDREQRSFEFANAGHPPPMVATADGDVFIHGPPHGDLPLGVEPHARYRVQRLSLAEGRLMLLYTDGLTERAADPAAGEVAVAAALAHAVSMAEGASDIIARSMLPPSSPDDIALVTVRLE